MRVISSALSEKELKDSFSITYCDHKGSDLVAACRLTYNRVLLIKTGRGKIMIDDNTFPITSNELFLVAKGQVLNFQARSGFIGYDLSFGDCFWEKAPSSASNCKAVLFNNASANQHLHLRNEDYEELNLLFQPLHREFLKEDYSNKNGQYQCISSGWI